MKNLGDLRVKIFCDAADITDMRSLADKNFVKGFTTNPTLMRKAGVADYKAFALEAIAIAGERPISFEVFSDDFVEMEAQARLIASWGESVYVKIPITNTRCESSAPLIAKLVAGGIKVNVTAILTVEQVRQVADALSPHVPSIVSVFAGRIADTGRDPVLYMRQALQILSPNPRAELLWASPRELLNIMQADELGCQIITVAPDILKKLPIVGHDLNSYSLETVRMFYEDGQRAGYKLHEAPPQKNYIESYLEEVKEIISRLDKDQIQKAIDLLRNIREGGGRLFILGVGGGAAHASHAVNDFRKLAGIEAYTPVDNVAELTARVNDDGWATVFSQWLMGCNINDKDAVLVFSVGGGNLEKNVSSNIVYALNTAKMAKAKIIGVVGRDGGYTAKAADVYILIPVINPENVTPHTEAFQAIIWHLIVFHPQLRIREAKWESVAKMPDLLIN